MEYGADEDETIAALLHDAGEDAGGEPRINDIRPRFGNRVADRRGAQASVRIWPGLRKKRQPGQESCKAKEDKIVVEQEQATPDDEAWAQAMLASFEAEDERMEAMAQYARQRGYVKPSEAALPKLNPDGTLASEADQPPASPQGTQ